LLHNVAPTEAIACSFLGALVQNHNAQFLQCDTKTYFFQKTILVQIWKTNVLKHKCERKCIDSWFHTTWGIIFSAKEPKTTSLTFVLQHVGVSDLSQFRLLSFLAPLHWRRFPKWYRNSYLRIFSHICASIRWFFKFGFTSTKDQLSLL